MVTRIWKYSLPIGEDVSVNVAHGATILSVGWEPKAGVVGYFLIPDSTLDTRQTLRFAVIKTGQPWKSWHPTKMDYIESVQDHRGFGFHVFYLGLGKTKNDS